MRTRSVRTPHVLVVEDYDDAREIYRKGLEFEGFRVDEARDGEEALAKASALRPDLVLLDLALPKMDGWEVARRLKAAHGTKDIVIVALTGHALEFHARQARNAGCDEFVAKPCLPVELVRIVRKALRSARARKAAEK